MTLKEAIALVNASGTHVVVPVEPTRGLLASMAQRNDHAIFDPAPFRIGNHGIVYLTPEEREQRIEGAISCMRQLHEEVVGTGFYHPSAENEYQARASLTHSEGGE